MVDFSKHLKRNKQTPAAPIMKRTITNNQNLAEPIYRAILNDKYQGGGDISITRLIAPPRIVALRKHYEGQIIEDAVDRVWSLLGQSVHLVIERASEGLVDVEAETRLYMPIEGITLPDGKNLWVWNLSGQPDIFERSKARLTDIKVTSVWSFMFGEKPEWTAQLNMQAMLHRYKGDTVNELRIAAILRDWNRRKACYEKDYPDKQAKEISLPMWSYEEQQDYAAKRVRLHQSAMRDFKLSGWNPDSLPLCTPEERWYRGAKIAVKKQDKTGKINKKADRLFETREDAEKFMAENASRLPKGKTYAPLQERPGINVRCIDFCDVVEFCPFGKAVRDAQINAEAAQREATNSDTDEAAED
jgi:hypothetical protein